MGYLLDTDIISAVLRPRPDLRVVRSLATVPPSDQFTSAITLGELVFGAIRKGRDDLLERIEQVVEVVSVLPFDESAAHTFGRLKAQLEQDGTPLAEPDLRIAAIALSAELTLVTGNERHFARVPGLVIENWLA
ncbi:MAG: PIN domain-containing protein [Chloroflexi bacterium]|nr:PIN domain-containing protein [Chloroflexota bacterium]